MTWPTIQSAARRGIANWRIGVVWMIATLIPTLILTFPVGRMLSEALDHSLQAGEWAKHLDLWMFMELVPNSREVAPPLGAAALMTGLTTLLLWPFLSAMIVTTSAEPQPVGFAALLSGGVRAYGRMCRMLLWSIVPFAIAGGIGGAGMHWAKKYGEQATLESAADHVQLAATVFLLLLLCAVHTTVEAGRAQLALDLSRRSAVKAWWRGVRLVIARPLATFGSYLALTVAGLALMGLVVLIRFQLPHSSLFGVVVAFCLTQLIVLAAVWMRTSRLLAMYRIGVAARA